MFSDYEQQTLVFRINYATRGIICYNQTIYDDIRLEMSEYLGLTLAVNDTYVPPKYSQVAIQILDNDSKQLILLKEAALY